MAQGLAYALASQVMAQLDTASVMPHRTWPVMADTVVVMAKGAREPEILRLARALAMDQGMASLMAGTHLRSTPERAALVNASGATFLELDEGFRPTGHPGIHLVPAILADVEARSHGATLRTLAESLTLGYEVMARLAASLDFYPEVHPHGHIGSVGVAAAIGHLRGWTVERVAHGMTIAASLPVRTDWRPCFTGNTVRNAFAGVGVSLGLWATDLVEAGFTGDPEAIERILAPAVGSGIRVDEFLQSREGWAIDRGYFKFYAGCALTHPSTEAALVLAAQGPWTDNAIREVIVEVPDRYMRTAAMPNGTRLSAKFSIPWSVAGALLNGLADDSLYQEPWLSDPMISRLAQRVRVQEAPDLTRQFPAKAGARVHVVLASGTKLSAFCEDPRGGLQRETSWEELRQKAEQLLPRLASSWWNTLTAYSDKASALTWWARVLDGLVQK